MSVDKIRTVGDVLREIPPDIKEKPIGYIAIVVGYPDGKMTVLRSGITQEDSVDLFSYLASKDYEAEKWNRVSKPN